MEYPVLADDKRIQSCLTITALVALQQPASIAPEPPSHSAPEHPVASSQQPIRNTQPKLLPTSLPQPSPNTMNAQKLRSCPCPPLDAKNAEIERYYMSEIGLFSPDLSVNNETPAGDLIYFRGYRVFRNVRLFIQQIKQVGARDGVSVRDILLWCLQGAALRWFNSNSYEVKVSIMTGPLRPFFDHLMTQFDEDTRIAKEQEEARLTAFACRRCPAKFPSNTKLHQHIQDHHQKPTKPECETEKSTPSEPAMLTTPPSTPKAEPATMPTPSATPPPTSEPALLLTPPITRQESTSDTSLPLTPPATPIATPRKPLSWAEIASRPVIAPKPSRLPVPTPKIIPKALETASITCPPTPPPTPPRNSTSKQQHQKPYLTIEDLYEMFDGKPRRMNLQHTNHQAKKRPSSPSVSSSYQAKITAYFRPAANQSEPISQGSKTPNPRSFQQHTPAESNRAKSNSPSKWFEKSTVLPYKTSTFSHLPSSEISSILPYKLPVISGRLHRSPTLRAPFGISASCHSCRICSGTFGSNNGLHRHLRAIHFGHAPRHGSEKHAPGRNTMAWRSLTSWRRNRQFPYFFSCITNRFLEGWIACPRHVAQRGRCGLLSLVASVTVNLHIGLESEYLDKNGLAPWQPDPYLALCLLDSNNSITLFITLLFNTFYRNNTITKNWNMNTNKIKIFDWSIKRNVSKSIIIKNICAIKLYLFLYVISIILHVIQWQSFTFV